MIDSYKKLWSNYANFLGRTSVKDYWFTILFYVILSIVISFVLGIVAKDNFTFVSSLVLFLFEAAHFIGLLSMTVRRLHDSGKSGTWLFISFVPFIGGIWLLILLISPSK